VKISGGGRDADGVQAHFEYIDRHGKLDIETDHGEVLRGKTAATEIIKDWALDYGAVPGAPHSRSKVAPMGSDDSHARRSTLCSQCRRALRRRRCCKR